MNKSVLLRAMFAEWRKLAPGLDYPGIETDDEARKVWTRAALRKPNLQSWKELSVGECRRLLKLMKEASGEGPEYRALLICSLAQDLFGAPWERLLGEQIYLRFGIRDLTDLAPGDARAEIEELLSRIARRDGIGIEEVRARFKVQRG